ncbi:MAG: ferredoxin [Rhodospirillaceae bacterium]|nr:ferredoxin [Rhodospirillaceae bacterium]
MQGGVFSRIDDLLAGTGLIVRGVFHPAADDAVPPLADGRAAQTVVLIGNAGPELWRALKHDNADLSGEHPLDRWVDAHLERAAAALGAGLVYATRKPWPPIQRWALKAGGVFRSPIGLLIHPGYGLWHVYRGALLFGERFDLPLAAGEGGESPCDTCADKPCLSRCPAGAFSPAGFDAPACVGHVESRKGKACATGGCLARRACPVGPGFAYDRDEGAYHMAAVVSTVRKMEARGEAPWKKPPQPER